MKLPAMPWRRMAARRRTRSAEPNFTELKTKRAANSAGSGKTNQTVEMRKVSQLPDSPVPANLSMRTLELSPEQFSPEGRQTQEARAEKQESGEFGRCCHGGSNAYVIQSHVFCLTCNGEINCGAASCG
jgi:hypothetical protein